jgi:hypothetical protein
LLNRNRHETFATIHLNHRYGAAGQYRNIDLTLPLSAAHGFQGDRMSRNTVESNMRVTS